MGLRKNKFIVFVRHGESETNVKNILSSAIDGYPLTDAGVRQAENAALALSRLPKIDALYSSQILRAMQTAEIIGKKTGMKFIVDNRLRERNFGSLEGNRIPDKYAWKLDPEYGISKWRSLINNMKSFIEGATGEVIVAVSHGDNMSAICDLIDGKGEGQHALACPLNCNFVIVDATGPELMAADVSTIPEDLIRKFKFDVL